ncbi:MAG: ATP-binding cassette domain-containing protein, partial [Bacteroidetes bacterium]|nr:ATP-binding cassette domain-containing protein [Bacteroidota bacterium]
MITIRQLHKSFGDHHVLRDIDLEIPTGQSIGIVGPNGSGKTTLIKTMLGLVKPDSGTITINNTVLNGNHIYRR